MKSCLALKYEALVLRDLKSANIEWLQVSHTEWLAFAKLLLENGFCVLAGKVNSFLIILTEDRVFSIVLIC